MVEVVRSNFDRLLPEIENRIKSCNFIGIDAEYTGLWSGDISDTNSLFDTPAARYKKLREKVVPNFVISQIGLAFFERSLTEQKSHLVNAYNFHVFPVAFDTFAKRDVIGMQVSCCNFLGRHNFDFNKFIKEGVPYLNQEKIQSLRKWLDVNRHFMNTTDYLDEAYFPKRIDFLKDADIQEIVEKLKGFSKIIEMIQKYKKPIVGHNMLMDLLLLYHLFIAELPKTYLEFKKSVHEVFPDVYDTKCIAYGIGTIRMNLDCNDRVLSNTNLSMLYWSTSLLLQFNLKPVIIGENETSVYQAHLAKAQTMNIENIQDSSCHTASFDATLTGGLFIKLGYLASRPRDIPEYQQGLPPTMTEIFKRLATWKNDVNIGRCIIPNINLEHPDPPSKRPDWINVKSIPGKDMIDPVVLKAQLVKYGDLEVMPVKIDEVNIACAGIGCSRQVQKELAAAGYRLSFIRIPSAGNPFTWDAKYYGAFAVVAITFATYLFYRKKQI